MSLELSGSASFTWPNTVVYIAQPRILDYTCLHMPSKFTRHFTIPLQELELVFGHMKTGTTEPDGQTNVEVEIVI